MAIEYCVICREVEMGGCLVFFPRIVLATGHHMLELFLITQKLYNMSLEIPDTKLRTL